MVGRGDGRKLHLRSVRIVSVARVNEIRSAAHEALLHAEQIRAIVQIRVMHAPFALLLVRLQRLLAEDVVPRQRDCNDSADSNDDSPQHFQIFTAFRASRT